jgi:hypothetical protein
MELPTGAKAVRYNHGDYELGLKNFDKVLPRMEKYLQEKIVVSEVFYDSLDGKTNLTERNIELKSRSTKYNRMDWTDWLVPVSKINKAKKSDKATFIFYYWSLDDSLWVHEYDKEEFDNLCPEIPEWHQYSSPHYYVPFWFFKRVD